MGANTVVYTQRWRGCCVLNGLRYGGVSVAASVGPLLHAEAVASHIAQHTDELMRGARTIDCAVHGRWGTAAGLPPAGRAAGPSWGWGPLQAPSNPSHIRVPTKPSTQLAPHTDKCRSRYTW